MITVLFHMSVKQERLDEFLKIAKTMTGTTRSQDTGCITYTFLHQADEPTKAVLFEQWASPEDLNNHVARLVRDMGPPGQDEALPPTHHRRRLPESFFSLFNETEAVRYDVLS